MPTQNPKILITFDPDLFEKIEDFRFDNRIQSRSEAVRILVREGLNAKEQIIPKKDSNGDKD